MEKTYARFLAPIDERKNEKYNVKVGEYKLKYVEFDEETTNSIKRQMEKYEILIYNSYCYEYDEDPTPSHGSNLKTIPVEKLISLTSGTYSSDEPRGDILILNGFFQGIVVFVERKGGNGWSNYYDSWYCILYADGRIQGKNVSEYNFSGESSSKENEYTYTLKEKKD